MPQSVMGAKGVQIGELVLASYILVFSALLGVLEYFSFLIPNIDLVFELIFWTVFFLAPFALGITVLLGTVVTERRTISSIFAGAAVVILLVVGFCLYWYFNPAQNGGLMVAHLISWGFGVLFALLVVTKHSILRVWPQ